MQSFYLLVLSRKMFWDGTLERGVNTSADCIRLADALAQLIGTTSSPVNPLVQLVKRNMDKTNVKLCLERILQR